MFEEAIALHCEKHLEYTNTMLAWIYEFLNATASCANICNFDMAQQPLVGQDRLIIDASRSHSDTPHPIGLLWTSDQPEAEKSTWQQTTHTQTAIHVLSGIRTAVPAIERLQAHVLDGAATGIDTCLY